MTDRTDSQDNGAFEFLAGGREMAKTVLATDWSRTALGPIEAWPQSLRTTVSLCLASNFPISIAWGPERIQIYNDGYWPICGAKHPHSMGQDFRDCWFSAWPVIGEAFARAQSGETSYLENQRMFLDRNGFLEETFFTFSFSPIRDESGHVGGLFHPVTETTPRMLAERRTRAARDLAARTAKAKSTEEACRSILEVLADFTLDLPFVLFYVLDEDHDKLRLAGSLGIPDEVAAAWPPPENQSEAFAQDVTQAMAGLTCGPYPEPLRTAMVLPIPGMGLNRPSGVLVAGVSTRLPLDEAYRGFYDLLAGQIGIALASARGYEEERRKAEALAELDRAKTVFFSNVSHEFRTPLALMLAPLEDLLAQESKLVSEHREELVLVHRNGLRLLKLVNTLLDFSRIEAGRIQASFEPTDLSQLTADLASAFRSAVERAGLELVVDCPPLGEPVHVDHDMWEKIVLNLISNAFKFTLRGRISVALRLEGEQVELTVEDTGAGIAEENLERIFERFYRVQGGAARTHEGTGIGLALVQELARLHGGTITVKSVAGQGSRFSVRIPRGDSHLPERPNTAGHTLSSTATGARPYVEEALRWLPESARAVSSPESAVERLPGPEFDVPVRTEVNRARGTILLADDNADMRNYLRRVLSEHYEVHAVSDGRAAWEFVRNRPVELILSDVMMPGMDGFELLRHVRSDARTKAIPLVLLSARAGEESRVEGLAAGADDYLIKPFTVRELLARVDAHVRLAKVRQETVDLKESELRFRTMADCAPVMIWTCGVDQRCDYFNTGWREFTGAGETESWIGSVHPDDQARCGALFDAAFACRSRFELEFRLRRADGRYHWVLCSGGPRYEPKGEFLGYIFSCADAQGRKEAEDQMQELNTELEMRVLERTAQLEAANKELEAFAYSVSHDLRAPLRGIDGWSLALAEDYSQQLDQRALKYLGRVRSETQRMGMLIDDLLGLSRVSRSEMQRTNVDLSSMAHKVAARLRESSPERKIDFLIRSGLSVEGDERLLEVVLTNLLSNAVKFTGQQERARIEFGTMENDGEQSFYVRDDGVGFDMAFAGTLFGAFQRLHKSSEFPGTGIGLATVQRVIHRHGGKVWADAQPGKGATFFFTVGNP